MDAAWTLPSNVDMRLAFLESLICDLHWVTIGQWRSCSEQGSTNEEDKAQDKSWLEVSTDAASLSGRAMMVEHPGAARESVATSEEFLVGPGRPPRTTSPPGTVGRGSVGDAGSTASVGTGETEKRKPPTADTEKGESKREGKEAAASGGDIEDKGNPWLFLDAREFGLVSQTCMHSLDLVSQFTPFAAFSRNVQRQRSSDSSDSSDSSEKQDEDDADEDDEIFPEELEEMYQIARLTSPGDVKTEFQRLLQERRQSL